MGRVRIDRRGVVGGLVAVGPGPRGVGGRGPNPLEDRQIRRGGQEAYEALAKAPDLKPADKDRRSRWGWPTPSLSQGQADKALATLKAVAPPSADAQAKVAEVLLQPRRLGRRRGLGQGGTRPEG